MPRRIPEKPFATARLVPALLDEGLGFDQKALDEAVRLRLVVPAKRFEKTIDRVRARQGKRRLNEDEKRRLYFIPIRYAGATDEQRNRERSRRSDFIWGRSDYLQTESGWLLKGLGSNKGASPPNTPGSAWYSRSSLWAERPEQGARDIEREFRGGHARRTVARVTGLLARLRQEYKAALREGDPVALHAKKNGIDDLPIPSHVAAFRPLEVPVAKFVGYSPLKRERTRASRILPPYFAREWRVWLYRMPHPTRFQEMQSFAQIDYDRLLGHFGIEEKGGRLYAGGKSITRTRALEAVFERHLAARALLVHLANNRLGISLTDAIGNTVFSDHNMGPAAFFDFDTASPTTYKNRAIDYWGSVIDPDEITGGYSIQRSISNLVRVVAKGDETGHLLSDISTRRISQIALDKYAMLLKSGERWVAMKRHPQKAQRRSTRTEA